VGSEYRPKPAVAVLLSIAFPGLGYAYCSRPSFTAIGFGSLLIALVAAEFLLMGSFAGLLTIFALAVLLQVGMIVHSGVLAAKASTKLKRIGNRWYVLLLVALVVELGLPTIWRATLFQVARYQMHAYPTTAMQPTILAGDRIVIDRWAFRSTRPSRGDLVMFAAPDRAGILRMERCVAVPGDTIAIKDKVFILNGEPALEPFVIHRDPEIILTADDAIRDNFPEAKLAPEQFFMLADDRDASVDSRYFGPVRSDLVLGKVIIVYWSKAPSHIGKRL
jgi:signal peptidase I